jgi:tRNA(Ile)-lysidine synthase
MLDKLREFIEKRMLCGKEDRILVTVSGGIDSVVLLDLLVRAGFDTGVAHCNFQLRGEESDGDARFTESLAEKYGLDFYKKKFRTRQVALEEGISIQMAARNLRYQWFEETRKRHGYNAIATAHNQDDVLETFFINLSRGTGIRGLTGIPAKAGHVIRPLLFASRASIREYAADHELTFREDSSNASDKYLRNRVRHRILPMLEEQNPSFRQSLIDTMAKLSETEGIFSREMNKLKESMVIINGDRVSIPIRELEKLDAKNTILYEILSDYNFGPSVIEDICQSLLAQPGKQFFSPTHRLVRDREELILTPLTEDEPRRYYLELEEGQIFDPIDLEWVIIDNTENFRIPKDPNTACLDLDLLRFPLILRRWQKGDYFQPLGMQGMKKLSDFLIDEKVSRPDKEKVWLLASGQKILWVIGYRIDERFRITERTWQVLMLRYSPGKRIKA